MDSENQILDLNEARELGASMLRAGHKVRFKLGGNSMFPFLKNGDVAVVGRLPIEQVKRGQIIVFEQQNKWIAHRLVKTEVRDGNTTKFVTRGDSAKRSDSPFTSNEYLGVVISFLRADKPHEMDGLVAVFYQKLMLWTKPIAQVSIHLFLRVKNRLQRA